jgi:positive phototaxis protein PixI
LQLQKIQQKFLQFEIEEGEIALLDAAIAPEIRLVATDEIVPVPQLPDWVVGIYQWRGEMLWLIDLGSLMEFSSLNWQNKNYTIVLQSGDRFLGLVVPKVYGLEEYDWQQLHEPSEDIFSPHLMPFVRGFFLKEDREIIKLLDLEGIFQACANG